MFNLFDPVYWLFAIPGLLLGIWAQIKLSHAYGKYSQVAVESGMSGAEAAREILDQSGLTNVPVEEIPGRLSDHYDPTKRALFLSSDNFHGRTVAAVGVAAHESGHALREHGLHGHFLSRALSGPVEGRSSHHHCDFCGDDVISTRHVAGGIRRQPPCQGTIVPAGPRA